MVLEAAMPDKELFSGTEQEQTDEAAAETTSGGEQRVRWQVVAVARGLTEAAVIRGRLESEGIPARVHQEPAGVAIGLTIGPLGEARVLVPEPLAERASALLNQPVPRPEEDED